MLFRFRKHPGGKLAIPKIETTKKRHKHGRLFSSSVRAIICGPSGEGKTSIATAMILDPEGLRFSNFYLFSPSWDQEKYRFVLAALRGVKGLRVHVAPKIESVEILPNSLIVLDDIQLDDNSPAARYFSYGRHKSVDIIYIAQSYSRIKKQLVRDNANLIIVLKQDGLNLKHIYSDHAAGDMSFERFQALARKCWEGNYNFLLIDKTAGINSGRYRRNFDQIVSNVNGFEEGDFRGHSSRKKKVPRVKEGSSRLRNKSRKNMAATSQTVKGNGREKSKG